MTCPLAFRMNYLMSVLLPSLLGAIHFRGVNLMTYIWFRLTVWYTSRLVVSTDVYLDGMSRI